MKRPTHWLSASDMRLGVTIIGTYAGDRAKVVAEVVKAPHPGIVGIQYAVDPAMLLPVKNGRPPGIHTKWDKGSECFKPYTIRLNPDELKFVRSQKTTTYVRKLVQAAMEKKS